MFRSDIIITETVDWAFESQLGYLPIYFSSIVRRRPVAIKSGLSVDLVLLFPATFFSFRLHFVLVG